LNEVRAHGAEVTDIAIHCTPGLCLVASSGRDRMVQLFKKTEDAFELIQTMDDHVGAVVQLLFMNDGERLLSCSADRTVIVREKATRDTETTTVIAFLMSKVITLKVSPLSMTIAPDDPDTLVLSTIDRHIQRFDVASGRHIHSFKAVDFDSNDAVVMSSLTVASEIPGQSPRILVGVSTTDKSIRVYDFERDGLLTKEFGHSEGVSDVILLERPKNDTTKEVSRALVSTGLDGVVMIWDLSIQQQQAQELSQGNIRDEDDTPSKERVAAKPPLRRILSRSELAGFRQDGLVATPTPVREQSPPRLRKKVSRYTLAPSLPRSLSSSRGGSPPPQLPPLPNIRRSPIPILDSRRSPSPPSPKTKVVNGVNRRSSINSLRQSSSIDFRSSRTKSSGPSEFGSLNMSTEQVCRTLRAYRKKLHGSTQYPRCAKELDRELNLTIHALGERAARHNSSPDTEMDSSEKENKETKDNVIKINKNKSSSNNTKINKKQDTMASSSLAPSAKLTKIARRVPSTPLLSAKSGARQVSRSRSLDADDEG
jgi:WD40 repeat protein